MSTHDFDAPELTGAEREQLEELKRQIFKEVANNTVRGSGDDVADRQPETFAKFVQEWYESQPPLLDYFVQRVRSALRCADAGDMSQARMCIMSSLVTERTFCEFTDVAPSAIKALDHNLDDDTYHSMLRILASLLPF